MNNLKLLVLAGAIIVFSLLSGIMLVNAEKMIQSLGRIPIQKVAGAGELHSNLVAQSFFIEGYIRYQDPVYLERFRHYSRLNREQLELLHRDTGLTRRPLVEKIATRQREHSEICDSLIIALVGSGNPAGVAGVAGSPEVVFLQGEILSLNEELKELRLEDAYSLAGQIESQSRQSLYWGIGLTFLLIVTGLAAGILVNKKMAMENMIYRLILLNTRNAIVVIRRDGRIYSVNRVAESIFGFRGKEVEKRPFDHVFTGRNLPGEVAFTYPVEEVMKYYGDACNMEIKYTDAGGADHTLLLDCLCLKEEGRKTEGAMLIIRDITQRKLVEEKLQQMAHRDSMTMLFNHSFLKHRLSGEIDKASRKSQQVAFMILDVDDFKSYNDLLGHPAGDELLKTLAVILEKSVRGSDIVGRYGGDEFAVILPSSDHDMSVEVGERLRRAVAEYPFPHREIMPLGRITVSVGLACYPDDATEPARLIELADEALYNAKRNAKNKVEVYFSAFKELQKDWPLGRDVLYNIKGLMAMVNSKDRYTYGHSEKVALYATSLAVAAGLDREEVKRIKLAAFLHDIGKIDVPEALLNKPGPLGREEYRLVQRHPERGAGIVGEIKSLEGIVKAILYHHERYDGRGYPHGLAAGEIPLAARIIAVADSFDAMTSHRPYRQAMTREEALREIIGGAGSQFDPELASHFVRINGRQA